MLHSFYPIVPNTDWLKRIVGLGAKFIQLRIKDESARGDPQADRPSDPDL